MAAILSGQPAPITTVAVVPPALEHAVRKCLEKEPDDRWQSAHDVASELRWIGEAGSGAGAPATVTLRRRTRERLAWALAALASVLAATFAAIWMAVPRAVPRGPIEIAVPVSGAVSGGEGSGALLAPALSPDATAVAYTDSADDSSARMLWVRRLEDARPHAIPGTEEASHPFWSHDGREIAYFARGKLWTISTAGGQPRALAYASYGMGGAWSPGGVVVFASAFGESLMRVSVGGGAVEAVTTLDTSRAESAHVWPVMLPDGQRFLFLSHTTPGESNRIEMASLAGGDRQVVLEADGLAGYVPPWLLFVRAGALWAQRFDPDRAAVGGSARLVAKGLRFREVWLGAGTTAVADAVTYGPYLPSRVAGFWYGPDGKSLGRAFELEDVEALRIMPDGRRVLAARWDAASGATDLWVLHTVQGASIRLTSTPASEGTGPLTRDGLEVLYDTDIGGAYAIAKRETDGLSEPSILVAEQGFDWQINDLSPDGRTALATRQVRNGYDIWRVPLDHPESRRPWLATEFSERRSRFSPDGVWVALESNRSGRTEIYLRRASGGPLLQISSDGGHRPIFRPDGRALYFVGPGLRVYEAPLSLHAAERVPGRPSLMSAIDTVGFLGYDVAPDGRILVLRSVSGSLDSFRVLLGWRERVEREDGEPSAPGQR